MTDTSASDRPDDDRVQQRAELLPEEDQAGSEDPVAQAASVLADSDFRTEHPEAAQRESHQLPPGGPRGNERATEESRSRE